ncbi:fatty acid synthase [Nephila pilipes]|uniref:Fatty acid synthase n=1 Tax=Nephila pilipes TaxID=299642 RepID=A0A8X6UMT2_NEPPI|nr:fatty acid synthase [Nephila pilipes]
MELCLNLITFQNKPTNHGTKVENEKRPVWYLFNCTLNPESVKVNNLMKIKVFENSIKSSAEVLKPCGLDLIDLVTNQNKSENPLRSITSAYSLIVAMQIALVDVLSAVGIVPGGLIGHGMGELLCGYVDGSLSAEQVILAAYWTAKALEESSSEDGTMVDLGISWSEAHKWCPKDIFLSRHLSEDYVTVSGPKKSVKAFEEKMRSGNIFTKEIACQGYPLHCLNMYSYAATEGLWKSLEKIMANPKPRSSRWISSSYKQSEWNNPSSKFADACYFVHNLVSPVLLHQALLQVPENAIFIEIAPHHLPQYVQKGMTHDIEYIRVLEKDTDSTVSVLSNIGRLYALGQNPDIEKLYPEVQFPVPKNTPMISPLIKWDHSKSWFVPRWDERLGSSEMIVDVDVGSEDSSEKYLLDHCIDGRILYPACGYLLLAWKALAEMVHKDYESLPVVFEDVAIHRATIVSKSDPITFIVNFTYIGKRFEVSEGGSIVCTGRMDFLDETEKKNLPLCFQESDTKTLLMNANDIYKELKLRGYEYGPKFQGIIGSDMEVNKGLLKWTGDWVPFFDSVFQFVVLNTQERALALPTRIQKLSVDPVFLKTFIKKSLKEYRGLPVFYDKYVRKLISGGIEMQNLVLEFTPRHPNRQVPLLEEYRFVPYHETNILSKQQAESLIKYIDVCSSVAKKTLELLGRNGDEIYSILKKSKFSDETLIKNYIESQTDDHVLLMSLCDIMDSATGNEFVRKVDNHINNYLFQRDIDLLSQTLLQENPLRGVVDIVLESTVSRNLKIAEISESSLPFCSKISEIVKAGQCMITNYAIAHSTPNFLDKSRLPSGNINISKWDPGTSLNFKDIDLFVTKYLNCSKQEYARTLENALVTIKDGGFIIALQRTRFVPAEMFFSAVGNTIESVHSESDLEQIFKDLKLRVICKKSDSLTSTLYLLRKIPVKSYDDIVIPIVEGRYEKWVSELRERVTNQPNDPTRIWLVSEETNCSGIIGLVNCLRLEPCGSSIRCVFISERASSLPQFSPKAQFYREIMENDLTMNVFKSNSWGTYRHFKMPEDTEGLELKHAYLNIVTRGNLSSLTWIDSPLKYLTQSSDIPLCHVYYAPLNFKDVMLATGKLSQSDTATDNWSPGLEFSGRLDNGRRVMGIVPSRGLATTIAVDPDFLWDVPDNWTLEEASTVPVAYATSYYALVTRGRLQRGERVLIHSGSGGVGQSAIAIALHFGCEVFTSVGTEEKKEFLKKRFPSLQEKHFCNSRDLSFERHILNATDGEGVDVILNSLADEKLKAGLNCIARHGRFLEIGKYDFSNNTAMEMELFSKNISFHGILLDALFENKISNSIVKKELVQLIYDGIANGAVRPLSSILFDYKEAEHAFRYMASGKHIGKVIIKIRNEEPEIKATPTPVRMLATLRTAFNPEKSYIIIGGLGGFGLEMCDWMVERGANHVILTSRSGVRTGYQRLRVNRWKAKGIDIVVSTENAANLEEAKLLLQKAATIKPIGGIFNLALVLRDAFMENQTVRNFEEVSASKVSSTMNLDALSRDLCPHLQWFVCFSSVSCGRGNAGQSNYGYANSVMERICEQRTREGLPGLAIQWGAIGDVGLIQDTMGSDVVIGGTVPQTIRSCLSVLDKFLQQNHPVVLSCVPHVPVETSSSKSSKQGVLSAVGKIFGISDMSSINPELSLGEMGMDSLIGVELRHLLERECDLMLGIPELRKLTVKDLKKLEGPMEGSVETSDTNVESDSPNIEEVPLYFSELDRTQLIPKDTIVCLNSVKSGTPLFILHPIEGTVGMLYPLAQCISVPVFGIQHTAEAPGESLEELAAWYWMHIKELNVGDTIFLAGYSFGSALVLEMFLQTERQPRQYPQVQEIIILDGSRTLTSVYAKMYKYFDHQEEIHALCSFVTILGAEINLAEYKEEMSSLFSTSDRIKRTADKLQPYFRNLTPEELQVAFDLFYKKIKMTVKYVPKSKLRKAMTLFKATESLARKDNISETYDWEKDCDGHITVYVLKGTHKDFILGESAKKVAELINDILSSEMFPDMYLSKA